MDPALTIAPPGSCYLLQHTAIPSPSLIPLLGNGSGVPTTAGAPLSPDLVSSAPPNLPGYTGLLGFTLLGVANFPCPGTFQPTSCALAGSFEQLAATCDSLPVCGGAVFLPTATPWLRGMAGIGNATRIGALKAAGASISPSQLSYTPFAAVYLKDGKMGLKGSFPGPPSGPPGSAHLGLQPAAAEPLASAGGEPQANASWSVLLRPQAELRPLNGSFMIAAPGIFLPGAQVSGQSIEASLEACAQRCVLYPDCKSVSYCPATEPAPCVVSAFGISPIPPGGCSMLYEQGVAQVSSIPLLARGPGIHTAAGVPVVARANLGVPGFRQHLAQALLGAYDLPVALCPGSLRPDHCRFVGTPQDIARRCSDNPRCFGFTWRESPALDRGANSSSGVLKGFLPGTAQQIDPRRINWNPGLSLFVQERVALPDAAPLPVAQGSQSPAPPATATASDSAADAAAGGLSSGTIAGIAVGAAVAGVLATGGFALWRRRRRRQAASGLVLSATAKRAMSGVDSAAVELAVIGSPAGTLTTPRQRGSPPRSAFGAALVSGASRGSSSGDCRMAGQGQHSDGISLSAAPSALPLLLGNHSGSSILQTSMQQPSAGSRSSGKAGSTAARTGQASTEARTEMAAELAAEMAAEEAVLPPTVAAQLLAELSPEWGEALVSEGDVHFLTGPDGRPITLGAGGFGQVYKVLLAGHTQCAAKIVPWQGREHAQRFFLQASGAEAAMLKRLRHPNVVGFQGICVTEQRGILLMDFCAGRDLDAVMHAQSRASGYGRGRKVAEDVASGLAYLHHSRILHLDLKPHNVLLARDGTARIGDVGLARLMSRTHLSSARFGTFDWASPELLLGQGATDKSDIWSFGMHPRRGQLSPLRVPEDCPAEVAALQAACIHPDPARRPSAAELVSLLMGLPTGRRPPPSSAPAEPATPPCLSIEAQRPQQGHATDALTEAGPQAASQPLAQASSEASAAARDEPLQAGAGTAADAPLLAPAAAGRAQAAPPPAALEAAATLSHSMTAALGSSTLPDAEAPAAGNLAQMPGREQESAVDQAKNIAKSCN
ncbi:hypothetical protein ABPG75_013081 [Micractinium tetrahymenae]